MKRLALLSFILAACGTSNNPPSEVQQQFFTQFSEVEQLQAQALQAQSSFAPAPYTGAIDYSGACSNGGTITSTGTYDGDGTSSNATYDENMTFDHCVVASSELEGQWHWTGTIDNGGEVVSVDADLTVTNPGQTAHVVYDLTMTFKNDGHFSIQGSMTIDGTRYDAVDFDY